MRAAPLVLAASATMGAASCHTQQAPIRDARAEAAASAAQRLQGRWLLVSFQPEVPLEPALQLLLDAQLGRFTLEVAGANLTGQGPGVTVDRTYRIGEAYLNHFKATVFDAYGIGSESEGDFSGGDYGAETLSLNGITAPWRGRAVFRRLP